MVLTRTTLAVSCEYPLGCFFVLSMVLFSRKYKSSHQHQPTIPTLSLLSQSLPIDPTRVGLLAAKNFSVLSPLINLTKTEVRLLSAHLSLPNHAHSASPCLRSRLAFGVEATELHLKRVERAEEFVRRVLDVSMEEDLRVRMLSGQRGMIELMPKGNTGRTGKSADLEDRKKRLEESGVDEFFRKELGFEGGWGVRAFKSGGVAVELKVKELDVLKGGDG